VEGLSVDGVVEQISRLGLEISRSLSGTSEKLVEEVNRLAALRSAVLLERQELERLRDVAARALDQMVLDFQRQREELEAEIAAQKAEWEESAQTAERERKEQEEQLARLRKEGAEFPSRIEREVEQAAAQAAKDAKLQAEQELVLAKKEAEAEKRIAELRIKTLEDAAARQNALIADMQTQVDEAKQHVQEFAVHTIEGASDAKTLAHVDEIAMEQGEHGGPQWSIEGAFDENASEGRSLVAGLELRWGKRG
jgi:colicin import membrane protein